MLLLIIASLVSVIFCDAPASRLVEISQGPVRGYRDDYYGIYVFHSIPYAKAPSGRDKFKAPLPPPVWTETLEAVDRDVICPQIDVMGVVPDTKIPQEDCLLVNVYVPDTNVTRIPVVVYVHGGVYIQGYSDMFSPKGLVQSKRVIGVTFNYRLSAHGFLCLGTKNIPGNAGMKDAVALLRWIKDNISRFGGDPEDVTLAGYSSGASAAELLMLSKMTKGLFKKVIPESGASINAFSVQTDPLSNAKEYARLLNFEETDNFHALEEFYLTIPYELLNSAPVVNKTNAVYLMSPCVERDIGEERFLDDSPINILRSGNFEKYPMLFGFTDMEGLFFIQLFDYWADKMNNKFSDFLPGDLQFVDDYKKESEAQKIKSFYFGNTPVERKSTLAYVDYLSDSIFRYATQKSIKLQVEAGNSHIYVYEYSYVDDSLPPVPYTNVRGALHCSQTFAVLDGFFNGTMIAEESISITLTKMKEFVRNIWLNFITTGNPTPTGSGLLSWPPMSKSFTPHMSINKTLELRGSIFDERFLFWEQIYDKYYRYPTAPEPPTTLKINSTF